jgi:hypothetical protein
MALTLGVVVAHPDVRPPDLVLLDDVLDPFDDFRLAWTTIERISDLAKLYFWRHDIQHNDTKHKSLLRELHKLH